MVIVDLEDAVHPGSKDQARRGLEAQLEELLQTHERIAPGVVQIRVNPHGSRWHDEDLRALNALPPSVEVRLPKVEDPWVVSQVRSRTGDRGVHVLIETPLGVERAAEIAVGGAATLGLGEADLTSALGVENADMLTWQRSRVINAAAAGGLSPPWMSAFPHFRDLDGLESSCEAGRRMGFLGRSAVHPAQLPVIRRAFLPSPKEAARASRILEAMHFAEDAGAGVWVLDDGSFVDAAMVGWAQRIQAVARRPDHAE